MKAVGNRVPTTLREVSAKLNLSQGLVSSVLNNRPGVRASPSTIERIRRYAAELNYEPSAAAKSLRLGKTNIVSFVFLDSDDVNVRTAHSHAAQGLAEVLQKIDYSLLVKISPDKESMLSSLITMSRQRLCDAVVIYADEHIAEPVGQVLAEHGMPFLLKGHFEQSHPDWLQVEYDHEGMMRLSTEKLYSLGHRRIFYLGFTIDSYYKQALLDGYKKVMVDLGLGHPPKSWIASVVNSMNDSEAAVDRWLQLPEDERPTAIVVGGSNNQYWAIERALAKIGRKIGLGPDDFGACGTMKPGTPLLFGEAVGFKTCDASELGQAQAERQLLPLLQSGECEQSIVHILPELRPLESLRLSEIP